MKNTVTLSLIFLLFGIQLYSQTAPTTGKQTLLVKESHMGEYLQTISQEGFSDVVIKAMKKRIPKKLEKIWFCRC